jgi:hypothetical protein
LPGDRTATIRILHVAQPGRAGETAA